MKTKAILCALFALLLLTGCAGEAADNPSVPEGPVWQAIPDIDYEYPIVQYFDDPTFVETLHGIVFRDVRDGNLLKYMDKATGEVRVLCGDPACDHCGSCFASGRGAEFSSLYYLEPEWGGRLYIARIQDPDIPLAEQRSEILSVAIDSLDLTVRSELLSEPGERIACVRFGNWQIMYSFGTTAEDGTTATRIRSMFIAGENLPEEKRSQLDSAKNTKMFGIAVVSPIDVTYPGSFESFIGKDTVYYSDESGVLRWYNRLKEDKSAITPTPYEGVLWTPEPGEEGSPLTYLYYPDYFLYCSGGRVMKLKLDVKMGSNGPTSDPTAPYVGEEIARSPEGKTYTSWTLSCLKPPTLEERYGAQLVLPKWAEITDNILYSLDDDPCVINTTDAAGKAATVTNVSGGKILRWVNGVSEPFADLGERTVIHSLTAIGDCVFIEATVYDEAGREQPQYFYTFGGRVCKVPMSGLP